MSFKDFSTAVQRRFADMVTDGALFRTDADPDELWMPQPPTTPTTSPSRW